VSFERALSCALADRDRIERFMRALGREASAAAHVYFTGGATAVLLGWRAATVDVDIKIVPESDAVLRAIPRLKESLDLNVELASPDHFIPVKDDWAERSAVVGQEGRLTFHHFDLYAQALAKIERGHVQDLGFVTPLEPMTAKAIYSFRMTGWPIMSARKRLTRKRGKCPRLEYARA